MLEYSEGELKMNISKYFTGTPNAQIGIADAFKYCGLASSSEQEMRSVCISNSLISDQLPAWERVRVGSYLCSRL